MYCIYSKVEVYNATCKLIDSEPNGRLLLDSKWTYPRLDFFESGILNKNSLSKRKVSKNLPQHNS